MAGSLCPQYWEVPRAPPSSPLPRLHPGEDGKDGDQRVVITLNRPSQSQRDRSDRAGLSFISHPPSHAVGTGSRPSGSADQNRVRGQALGRPGPASDLGSLREAGGGAQTPEAKAPGGAPGQAQRGGGRAGGSGALTCVLGVSTRWWKSPTFPGLSCGAGRRGERPEPLADGHLASPAS